jgi:hypothetical protein
MNASAKYLELLRNPWGCIAHFDIDLDYLKSVTKVIGNDFVNPLLNFCESISNPCIVGFGDITQSIQQLKPKRRNIAKDEMGVTKEIYFDTPIGKKGWVLKHMKHLAVERISEATVAPVSTKEDFALFDWYYDVIKKADWSPYITDLKAKIAALDGRALTSIFLVPPYELLYWTKREEIFLLYFDYPELYHNAMNKIIAAFDIILGVAQEAGVTIADYGAPGGTEFTSPDTWKEGIVPTSQKLESQIKSHGMYSIFHCCGKVHTIVEKGFLNDISPSIYETLSPPPVGDILDIVDARAKLSKNIITHGNIDLTFIKDSSVEQVKKKAIEIREQTHGFPHIVGAADGCLWPGTPVQNLKAVCEMLNNDR